MTAHRDPPERIGLDRRTPGTRPRVSVVVPIYGVADMVGQAMASIQAQTLRDWECIAVDDGSPDDVAGALAPFLADSRIRLIRTENRGVSAARNTGIADANAPLIALLDGDDILRPAFLETMLAQLEGDPAAAMASCNARLFEAVPTPRPLIEPGTQAGEASLPHVLTRDHLIYGGCMFRKASWERVGGFDETLSRSEDFDLWVRFMCAGERALYVDEVLCEYRVRPKSASRDLIAMLESDILVYRKVATDSRLDQTIRETAEGMIATVEGQMARAQAVEDVIAGKIDALETLRAFANDADGPLWIVSYALWRVAPWLAPPMLRWRETANAKHVAGLATDPIGAKAEPFRMDAA